MRSFFVENVLTDDEFKDLKAITVNALKDGVYTPQIGRWHADVVLNKDLSDKFLSLAKDKFGINDLVPTYIQVAKYQIVDGAVPKLDKHTDKLACTHTIDIAIETTVDWGLFVEDVYFKDVENCAVFLKGDLEEHYRPEYPSTSIEDYCIVLFINFATPDHWSAKVVKSVSAKALNILKKNRTDYLT